MHSIQISILQYKKQYTLVSGQRCGKRYIGKLKA